MATFKCRQCGYDVTAVPSGTSYRCPECGSQDLPLSPDCPNVELWSARALWCAAIVTPTLMVTASSLTRVGLSDSLAAIVFWGAPLWSALLSGLVAGVVVHLRATSARNSRVMRFAIPAILLHILCGSFIGLAAGIATVVAMFMIFPY